jgi:hypothetical protein
MHLSLDWLASRRVPADPWVGTAVPDSETTAGLTRRVQALRELYEHPPRPRLRGADR